MTAQQRLQTLEVLSEIELLGMERKDWKLLDALQVVKAQLIRPNENPAFVCSPEDMTIGNENTND